MYRLILPTVLAISLSASVGCRQPAYGLTPSATLTSTATTPTATPTTTATTPTATPTISPIPCSGDCDQSGAVTIDELVLMVNVALESAPSNVCAAGDADGSGTITIDEIVQAVNAAVTECPTQQTPTSTPTPNGEFKCSAGPHDQAPCNTDDDCAPTGACVVAYGVCYGGSFDGFSCDCPGGTCVAETCQDGPFAGDPCSAQGGDGSCGVGGECTGSSRICLAGDFKAYPCLKDDDCIDDDGTPETCGATAQYCDGGEFDGSSCVDDTDCTGGGNGCSAPHAFGLETPEPAIPVTPLPGP